MTKPKHKMKLPTTKPNPKQLPVRIMRDTAFIVPVVRAPVRRLGLNLRRVPNMVVGG